MVPATPTALPRRELRSHYCFCSSTSACVVPSPTVAFTINPILSTDPTVALRPPTIGPIKQSNTLLSCWPQLDPTVTAKQRRPPHRSSIFLCRIATLIWLEFASHRQSPIEH